MTKYRKNFYTKQYYTIDAFTRDDPKVLIVARDIFERHTMHHSNVQALAFIMMLVFSRCTVSLNNYSTIYMVHSIPLACFHVIEL